VADSGKKELQRIVVRFIVFLLGISGKYDTLFDHASVLFGAQSDITFLVIGSSFVDDNVG
jgi:hypothetical protein